MPVAKNHGLLYAGLKKLWKDLQSNLRNLLNKSQLANCFLEIYRIDKYVTNNI